MNSKFKKKTVIAAIALLVIALAAGLYFGLAIAPLNARTAEVEAKLDGAAIQKSAALNRKNNYDRMVAELESLKQENAAPMPYYDNNAQQAVLAGRFAAVLDGLERATVSYGTPSGPVDGVLRRTVRFSFAVSGENAFSKAADILRGLLGTGFKCSLDALELTPAGGDLESASALSVGCAISFYELEGSPS